MGRLIRGRSSFAVRGPKRLTTWIGSANISSPVSLAAGAVVLDQSFSVASNGFDTPFTVVRVRGELWTKSDQIIASENPFGAMGAAVVSQPALTAGVASVPTPISEEASELWFLHQFWASGFTYPTTARAETLKD